MTASQLLAEIAHLNDDPSVHGILVQLPLPKHISEPIITAAVSPFKDVDGFSPINVGELAKRGGKPYFVPCTPKGVMVLLEESKVHIKGKRAVVLGRSDIVGKPVSYLLEKANATVTVCHSKTENIKDIVSSLQKVTSFYLLTVNVGFSSGYSCCRNRDSTLRQRRMA